MSEIKWIKISTNIFDDEKILLIESMPDKYAIITCWFKLLCMAGKQNNSGVFTLNDKLAYTDEMLSTIFRMPLSSVRLALETFEKFGMIETINGVITIPNWDKHQSLDAYEKKKEYDRQYQAQKRLKQKELVENRTTTRKSVVALDIDIDKEEDKDKEKELSKDNNILSQILQYWNEKSKQYRAEYFKMPSHKTMTPKLEKALTKALELYGFNSITLAIEHYARVGNDKNYYFKYTWNLEDFVKQSNALPEFLDDGKKWINYCNSNNGKKTKTNEILDLIDVEEMKKDGWI